MAERVTGLDWIEELTQPREGITRKDAVLRAVQLRRHAANLAQANRICCGFEFDLRQALEAPNRFHFEPPLVERADQSARARASAPRQYTELQNKISSTKKKLD